MQKLIKAERGAIYVEFLLVFIPIFLVWMAIMQLALFSSARLTVQHAAIRGVRSAIVVIDDDPQHYNNVPRGCLTGGNGNSVDGLLGRIAETALNNTPGKIKKEAGLNKQSLDRVSSRYNNAGPRMQAIRNAVYTPLLTLAPDPRFLWDEDSMRLAVGFMPESRMLSGLIYNKGGTAVTFPSSEQGTDSQYQIAKDANVTVRVTYLYHCAVPLVSYLMCKPMDTILGGLGKKLKEKFENVEDLTFDRNDFLDYQHEDTSSEEESEADKKAKIIPRELAHSEVPGLQILFGAKGQRFKVFREQATLPNQASNYKYKSELENSEEPVPCEPPKDREDDDAEAN
ncbi:MAG: pilus assembly protein [Myxococcales bacterium]|nr:MAG: pilus assembly protein [Myxococcales bacterium]